MTGVIRFGDVVYELEEGAHDHFEYGGFNFDYTVLSHSPTMLQVTMEGCKPFVVYTGEDALAAIKRELASAARKE